MTHVVHLLAGAYVLDALDEGQRIAFTDHLADCSECRAEFVGLREGAALLSQVTALPPPPELRARILARITQVRPLPPVVTPAHPPATSLAAPPEAAARSPRRLRWVSLVVAAAVVLIIGAGMAPGGRPDDASDTVGAVAQVLHAPDRKHSTVESDAGWAVTVWHSDSVHQAVIVTTNMPAPPAGMVYQVWLDQPSSGFDSAGLMPVVPDQSLLLHGDAASANGTRVTLEPEGGSMQPTSDPVAVFDFGQGA